jgi:WD40 repeat protein
MTVTTTARARAAILAVALVCACKPAVVPIDHEPAPDAGSVQTQANVISSSNVEQIVLLRALDGHSRRVLDLAFSARGEFIATSGQDLRIRLWETATGQERHTFDMHSVDMADIDVSVESNLLASGEAIWELGSMQELHALERGSQIPTLVAFYPDGSVLALSSFDRDTELWDVSSGQRMRAFPGQAEKRTKRMEFSPDGALLAVGVINGSVWLWDTESGELATVLKYPSETDIHDLAFSPDGRFLASGGRVPAVVLWDVASGDVVRRFTVRDCVNGVAFSPDGTLIAAAGGQEKAILLWDVESGDRLRTLPLDDQSMAIAFSPDGSLLAAGSFSGRLYLWGIATEL